MPSPNRPPTNYRQRHRDQEKELLLLVVAVLVLLGTGLIGLIWGLQAALSGGLCLLAGASVIGGLWLLIRLAERWLDE